VFVGVAAHIVRKFGRKYLIDEYKKALDKYPRQQLIN